MYFGNAVSKDERQGIILAKKAAFAGDMGANAFVALAALERPEEGFLGILLFEGKHLSTNREEAFAWLERAANAGDIQSRQFISEHS